MVKQQINKNKSNNTNIKYNNYNKQNQKQEDKKVLRIDGVVKDIFPGQKFLIEFPNGHQATGSLSGKMTVNSITLECGDTVCCEIPVDNVSICRITYRKKTRNYFNQ